MKKLHLFILLILTTNLLNAQLDLSSPWGVIGSAANNWGNDGPDLPFYTTDVSNVFVAYVTLTDGEIKFRENNDWGNNYGDNDTNGTLESGGANIPVSAGIYKIVIDLNLFTYTIENYTWGLVGSDINGWGATPDIPLIYDPYSDKWRVFITLGIGELLIRFNNDWTLNYGDVEPNGLLDVIGGNNIAITAAGDYLVTVDFNTLEYSIEPTWLLSTFDTGTGYNWPDIPLTYDPASDQWSAEVTFATSELLISQNNGLGLTYGDTGANGILDQDGDAIVVTGGNYIVTVDFNSLEYFIEPTFNYNWGLVGSATPNGWGGPDFPFYSTDVDNEYVTYVTLIDGEVKIRENNSWTLNYGDNEPDGILEEGGANIAVTAGTYRILFNFITLSYTIENYTWGLVGNTINGWGATPDLPLTYDPDSDEWRIEVTIAEGEFKIRLNNDWSPRPTSINYGDFEPDGILDELPNNNIAISSGDYLITVDFDNLEYFIYPQFVSIPDPNFEQALIDLGIDSDPTPNGLIYIGDALLVSNLNVNNRGITSMQGIEAFVNLTSLNVSFNPIGILDITQNIELEFLQCGFSELTSLDITQNTKLKTLWTWVNELTELDTSNNLLLEDLQIGSNLITSVDLTNNVALTNLEVHSNLLTVLDVSQNINLESLWCFENQLTSLDVTNNGALQNLYCADNLLTSLNIANGNNINMIVEKWNGITVNTTNNPDLDCIQVDADIVSSIPESWEKDQTVIYSSDCTTKPEHVYIPDPYFEQSLIDIGIDSDGVVNTWLLKTEAEAETDLNLNNPIFDTSGFENLSIVSVTDKIGDLTGIEAFTSLINLQVSYGDFTSVDLTQNIILEEVFINDGVLTSFDIANNPLLRRVGFMRNNISGTVDISQNPDLTELYLHSNSIDELIAGASLNLWRVAVQDNNLTNIDITGLPGLTYITCYNNQLSQLDISSNAIIGRVDAHYNSGLKLLTTAITGSPSLTSLNLSGTGLSNFNPTLFPNLEWLLLEDNNLSKLTTTSIPDLKNLYLNNNVITSLDLTSNTLLERLYATNNQLTELNVNNGFNDPLLVELDVSSNLLTCITADSDNELIAPYNTWIKDVGVILSLNCGGEPEVILIPDTNFENSLIAQGYDTNSIVGSILKSEAEALTSLNVSGNSILDLTGIEGFINLTDLDVSDNFLSTINLFENTDLINVDVSQNLLTDLFISSGRDLVSLDCSDNQITSLNFADLIDLEVFNGSINLFENIDATSHDLLISFNVSFNRLTELDMRNGNNSAITLFDATNNPVLFCIGVDDSTSILAGWSKDGIANYSNDPDCIPPTIVAQLATIYLDFKGDASVIASDFDDGSFDNVTLNANLTFSVDIEDFNCSNLGSNNVVLTVTDEVGNFSTENVVVNVVDNIPPSVSADPTFSYDLNGDASFNLEPLDIHKSSSDNCGEPTLSLDQTLFTSPGIYTVTLTATDGSSNPAEDNTEVTIEDSAASTDLKFKKNLVLTIYPVPFTDVININFSKPTDLTTVFVTLLDFSGFDTGITFSENGGSLISDYTGGLSSAMFILQITVAGEAKTVTIISDN